MDKTSLRKKYHLLRDEAHERATPVVWRAITKNLLTQPFFSQARNVLLYASKGSEVPTHDLLQKLLDEGRQVCLPIAHVKDKDLELSFIRSLDDLVLSSFGVLEPKLTQLRPCPPQAVQVAVVPGVAFDPAGYRLGYGYGFYDRFLPRLSCPAIGLAYEAQIAPELPHEAHDVPLSVIVTEKRVMTAKFQDAL
ncbi:MAG: 5-formyltetrahydrofolate cyclo-ligase [Candidatus Micrarchaeota archaeon]|nr:5-formyltetrahydrofolate cyclo-ligase [Candidatus Micrarchaeota archaeon]